MNDVPHFFILLHFVLALEKKSEGNNDILTELTSGEVYLSIAIGEIETYAMETWNTVSGHSTPMTILVSTVQTKSPVRGLQWSYNGNV